MEYAFSSIIVAVFSIFFAFTAEYSILTLPWCEIYRHPMFFFDEKKDIRRVIYIILAWIAISVTISIIFTTIIQNSSTLVKTIYSFIGYDNPAAGKAGLLSTITFNLVFYWYLVYQIKQVIENNRVKVPKPPVLSLNSKNDLAKSMHHILCWFLGTAPRFLAPFYEYFKEESKRLAKKASLLLVENHGSITILQFFNYHLYHFDNQHLKDKSRELDRKRIHVNEKAFSLLLLKIELKGYNSTASHINHYLEMMEKKSGYKEKRKIERTFVDKGMGEIPYRNGKVARVGKVVECSLNGSGCFISTEDTVSKMVGIKLLLKNTWHDVHIVHTDPLQYCGPDPVNGFALKIDDNKAKANLLDKCILYETWENHSNNQRNLKLNSDEDLPFVSEQNI